MAHADTGLEIVSLASFHVLDATRKVTPDLLKAVPLHCRPTSSVGVHVHVHVCVCVQLGATIAGLNPGGGGVQGRRHRTGSIDSLGRKQSISTATSWL